MPKTPKPIEPPPLGVTPRRIWIEQEVPARRMQRRLASVEAACERYRAAGLLPKPEWLAELREHRGK